MKEAELTAKFQEAKSILEVVRLSKTLRAEGFPIAEVNAAASKRRKQISSLSTEVMQKLNCVRTPVLEKEVRCTQIRTEFKGMRGNRLFVTRHGEFIWK